MFHGFGSELQSLVAKCTQQGGLMVVMTMNGPSQLGESLFIPIRIRT
jgi:hypothetical protein